MLLTNLCDFFVIKMNGVNIFGSGYNETLQSIIKQGPPGVGFKYLDSERNFDIQHKRLANVGKPQDINDAVTKEILDKLEEKSDFNISTVREDIANNKSSIDNVYSQLESLKEVFEENSNSVLLNIDDQRQDLINHFDTALGEVKNEVNGTLKHIIDFQTENTILKANSESLNEKVETMITDISVLRDVTQDVVINSSEIERLKQVIGNLTKLTERLKEYHLSDNIEIN